MRGGVMIVVDTVECAEKLAEVLRENGHKIEAFHAKLPKSRRRKVLEQLALGTIDGITATTIGDEGIDIPEIQHVILLSGKALGRHRQRLGRAARPKAPSNVAYVHDICVLNTIPGRHSALRYHRYKRWGYQVRVWETKPKLAQRFFCETRLVPWRYRNAY